MGDREDDADRRHSDIAISVVRRNTEEVQVRGNGDLFEELFADDFVDAAGSMVTTYKIYRGTQTGPILGVAPTGRPVEFETRRR